MLKHPPKEKFIERMRLLLNDEEDLQKYLKTAESHPRKSFRVNTLKISITDLKNRLEEKGWKIKQPYKSHPEIMVVENELTPGELGNSLEHRLGYYYIQEITSMMPIIALDVNENDSLLDLCASPGSKTTQAAMFMKNAGVIFANDISIGRVSILVTNLERCGVTNVIVTRHHGTELCQKMKNHKTYFNKILIDAPCSGEGNIRSSPRTFLEWSPGLIKGLSQKQIKLVQKIEAILEKNGELIYSTCTHAPEENEEIVQYLIDNGNLEIISVEHQLPQELRTRPGITTWRGKTFHPTMKNAVRIYPHDNDLEGFFLCKLRKV